MMSAIRVKHAFVPPCLWAAPLVYDDVAQSAMKIDDDSLISDVQEPNTYEQAIATNHHKEWHNSMTKEWTELLSNNTFHEPIDR